MKHDTKLAANMQSVKAVVAEWLRRLTRNQIPSGSVGSSPTDRDNFYHFFQKKEVLEGFSDKKGS